MAGLAGLAALGALAPGSYTTLDVRTVSESLDADPIDMRVALLTSDVRACDARGARLNVKVARLRLASRLLMASVAFATLTAIVEGTV